MTDGERQQSKNYIDQCLERAEKATKGPWVKVKAYDKPKLRYFVAECTVRPGLGIADTDGTCFKEQDAEFIAHARTDVPILALRLIEACHYLRTNGLGHLADALEKEPDGR